METETISNSARSTKKRGRKSQKATLENVGLRQNRNDEHQS